MKLKYQAVLNDLENKIIAGIWPEGVMIPTELELCEKYHVSRITIRRALDEMTRAGMIERARGKGTFVRGSRRITEPHISGIDPFAQSDEHSIAHKIILDLEYPLDSDIALNMLPQFKESHARHENLHRIKLLSFMDATPFAVMNIFFPSSVSRMLDRDLLASHSFIETYEKVDGASVGKVLSSIGTVVPDKETSELLGTRPQWTQLWVKTRIHAVSGELIAINYTVYDGNLFEYRVTSDLALR